MLAIWRVAALSGAGLTASTRMTFEMSSLASRTCGLGSVSSFTSATAALGRAWALGRGGRTPPAPSAESPRRQLASSPEERSEGTRREYPPVPRVGVGVVVLRRNPDSREVEVIVVRRGKPPAQGMLSFPGGGQEIGETMAECAVREIREECGIELKFDRDGYAQLGSRTALDGPQPLDFPVPFACVDAIFRDDEGRPRFHYTIVEVAGTPMDPRAEPRAADDVDEAFWVPVSRLPELHAQLNPHCSRLGVEAAERFVVP